MPRRSSPGTVGAHAPPVIESGAPDRTPAVTPFERFLLWERSSRDTIEVKRTYIDIAGDLVAGILLSQIVYWHLPDRDGNSRLRVHRDGKFWIAKGRAEWWDECRVSPKQVDRALEMLRNRSVIQTGLFKFNGSPTVHVRLDEVGFMAMWESQIQALDRGNVAPPTLDFPQGGRTNSPEGGKPSSAPGNRHVPRKARTSTEKTSETGAETTTTPAVPHKSYGQDDGVVVLLRSLTDLGVTKRIAERLVNDYPPKVITDQLAMLQHRKADDPPAVLVRAIEEEWAPPADYRHAQAERKADERRRQRDAEKAAEETVKSEAADTLRATQNELWAALSPDEQQSLLGEAERNLRIKSPFLFEKGGPKKTGVIYQTMLETERRQLLKQAMLDSGNDDGLH